MAAGPLSPIGGSVTLGSSAFVADFNAFRVRVAQGVEGITPFGTNTCSVNVGAGTPDFAFSISAALLQGLPANAPGVATTYLPGLMAVQPGSVFGFAHLCTLTCDVVIADVDMGAARMRAAVPIALSGKNAGEVTEAWVVS